jgi:hypothetical protein
MIALSWELAGFMFLFQVLQAITAGLMIALLLWFEKRIRDCSARTAGDTA